MALFGDSSADAVKTRLNTWGVTSGVLKCGAAGPVSLGKRVDLGELEPITEVVDSTAAGDSINGAFLASYLQQKSLIESIRNGHQCACKVIGNAGAIIPQTAES